MRPLVKTLVISRQQNIIRHLQPWVTICPRPFGHICLFTEVSTLTKTGAYAIAQVVLEVEAHTGLELTNSSCTSSWWDSRHETHLAPHSFLEHYFLSFSFYDSLLLVSFLIFSSSESNQAGLKMGGGCPPALSFPIPGSQACATTLGFPIHFLHAKGLFFPGCKPWLHVTS